MNRKFAYILLLLLFLILGGAGCFLMVSDSILLTGWMWTVPASYAPEDATLSAPVHNTVETKESEETVLPTLPELPSANSEESAETMENTASEESAETESASTETADAPEKEYTYTAVHKSKRLFIRQDASLNADIIGFLKPGDSGDVISILEDWVLLRHGNVEGYVSKKYLTLTEKVQAE